MKQTIAFLLFGAVHNGRSQAGVGGLSIADKGRGVLQIRTYVLFYSYNFGFFEISDVFARTKGRGAVRTFFGQGGGANFFAILCGHFYSLPMIRFHHCDIAFSRKQVIFVKGTNAFEITL